MQPAWSQSGYTIEQVTSGSVNHRAPSINNLGEIVWMEDTGSGRQVFSSTRGQLTSPSGNYTEAQYPALADDGSFVCFRPGSLPCTGSGYLLRYPGESTVEFCSCNGASHRDPIPQSGLASNGRVIWGRKFYGTTGLLQTERFFLDGTQVSGDLVDWRNPSINRHGEYLYDLGSQVYSSTRGQLVSGIQPGINDRGDVCFVVGSEVRVILATGAVRIVAAGSDPGINQQGTVAFERSVAGLYQIFRGTPAPDLVATTLAWNSSQGGLDFQYEVVGPATSVATTAKLFWANGTTTAAIVSPTPVFTHPIPSGASGPSSLVHVDASSFAAPPAAATHVVLALDFDNVLQEADESNNSRAVSLCPVSPLTLAHMDEPPYDESFLAVELRQALACFRDAVTALGGSATPTSGYRSTEYQAHLYELRTKFVELSQVNGIIAYVDGRRPQLATTPGTIVCQSVVDAVNSEIRQHLLVARTDGTPAVSAPGGATHELGRAVDVSVSGLPATAGVDRLARNGGLAPPWTTNAAVESSMNLAPGSWTQIQQSLNPTNGLVLTNLMSGPHFFRLRIP